MKKRRNPGFPMWLLPVLGAGAVGGIVFWLYRRDKSQAAATLALQQPLTVPTGGIIDVTPPPVVVSPQVQQAAAAVFKMPMTSKAATLAVTTGASSFGAAPPLTPQQAAEMTAYPETQHGAGHF